MTNKFSISRSFLTGLTATLVTFLNPEISATEITILVNPGIFPLTEAGSSEAKVNWWDNEDTDDTACTESFAADELKQFLSHYLDSDSDSIVISDGTEIPSSEYVFVLGSRTSQPLIKQLDAKERLAMPDAEESFQWRIRENGDQTICVIEGHDRVGTLYGVYDFLETIGIRFYGLGDKGTIYPEKGGRLPLIGSSAGHPDFRSRGFWAFEDRGNEDFFYWMARNKLNYWTAAEKERNFCKKLGLKLTIGGHDFQHKFLNPEAEYPYNHPLFEGDELKLQDPYLPPAKSTFRGDENKDGELSYFEAHPEWYGLLKGKRRSDLGPVKGTNFCTSNDDAISELAKNFARALIDGEEYRYADIVQLWMLDNGKWCQCQDCRKVGNLSDQLVQLVHKVRKYMEHEMASGRLMRNVEIVSLAYHETLPPPSKPLPADFDYENCYFTYFPIERTYTHALNDPASTEVNQPLSQALQGWIKGENRNYKGALCIGEYYNVSRLMSLPVLFTKSISVDIPWYYEIGSRHFHYMHVPTRDWGTWTLNQYLIARLLWDHEAESSSIIDDYFRQYYPTTTTQARTFYEHLETATANAKAIMHYIGEDRYALRAQMLTGKKNLFPKKTLQLEPGSSDPNSGISLVEALGEMDQAEKALDEALLLVTNPREAVRLREDKNRFAYGKAMYQFYYHMARLSDFHNKNDASQARQEFEAAREHGDLLLKMTDVSQVSSAHANSENGFTASQIDQFYYDMKERYGK